LQERVEVGVRYALARANKYKKTISLFEEDKEVEGDRYDLSADRFAAEVAFHVMDAIDETFDFEPLYPLE